jgi:alanine racemase
VGGRLLIDLDALAANFRTIRTAGAPAVTGAVVKADAYGLGALPVANRLWREGCRDFFVATCREGEALRAVVPRARILVFEGAEADTVAALCAAGLVPVLNHDGQLDCWRANAPGRPAAVMFDTGMHRLGFSCDTPTERFRDVPVELLMTHLACADEPDHSLNRLQLERFASLCARFPGIPVSICNSAAALGPVGRQGDLCRAGIGLFGGNPFVDLPNPMGAVVTLEGRILQVRTVAADEAVGYGASFRARETVDLAVVGVGYADGLPRLLSNRGMVWIAGERRPIVGRVSMDLTIVDVTGLSVQPGQWAEFFGAHVALDEVAGWAGTIGYEVLTRLGARLERIYRGA